MSDPQSDPAALKRAVDDRLNDMASSIEECMPYPQFYDTHPPDIGMERRLGAQLTSQLQAAMHSELPQVGTASLSGPLPSPDTLSSQEAELLRSQIVMFCRDQAFAALFEPFLGGRGLLVLKVRIERPLSQLSRHVQQTCSSAAAQ